MQKQQKQISNLESTIRKVASITCLGFISYTLLYDIYQTGFNQGMVKADQRLQHEKVILTNTGYQHIVDTDLDGKYDIARQVTFGTEGHSDVLYVKKNYGPSQTVSSIVTIVEDEFFREYNTQTRKPIITTR